MSLLNQKDPFDTFSQCAARFLESAEIGSGIEFDDAVIALKRHARVVLQNEALATELEPLSRLIREREMSGVAATVERVMAMQSS